MKKVLILMGLFVMIAFPPVSFAGSGSAIIPFWIKNSGIQSDQINIYISNISNATVTVKVTLYDHNGNIYNEASEPGTNFMTQLSFLGSPIDTSGGTLGPHQTGILVILPVGEPRSGYGVIKWETSGDEPYALIATARLTLFNGNVQEGTSIYSINDYKPF